MATLNYIFGRPDFIEGVGNIYPIRIKDYEEFNKYNTILLYNKNSFVLKDDNKDILLLDLLVNYIIHNKDKKMINDFEKVFSLVFQKDVKLIFEARDYSLYYYFKIDDNRFILRENYDKVRQIIMKQNLIFEPIVYENKTMQEWAVKVIKARSKKKSNVEMEDIVELVSRKKHLSIEEVFNYTLYQLMFAFQSIIKEKNHDDSVFISTVANCFGGKVDIEDYLSHIDLFKNPYENVFVDSSKLNSLAQAISKSN